MAEPKELALEHFEKVLLAVAVAVVGYTLATSAGTPEAIKDTASIDKDRKSIDSHMKSAKPEVTQVEDHVATLKARLEADAVPSAQALPAWMLYRRPGVLTKEKPQTPTAQPKHYSVTDLKLDSSARGKVVLTWERASDNDYVVVTDYVVQRREGTDGEWKELARLTNDKLTYTDESLGSRTSYFYRVSSIAEIDRMSKRVQLDKMTLDPSETEKISNEAGPVTTERDVYLIPQNVTVKDLIANANAKDEAYVYVYKFDAESGAFLPKKGFRVLEGDPIGGQVKSGRKVTDYSTGATFVRCRHETGKGKFGQEVQVGVITIRWQDGTEEEARTTDDAPGEKK